MLDTINSLVPLKNYPILSGRSIRSFRHLELKDLSIISDFREIQEGATILEQEEEQEEQQEEQQEQQYSWLVGSDGVILLWSDSVLI